MCMITERKKVKEMFIKLLQTIHNQKYLNMSGNTNISNLKKKYRSGGLFPYIQIAYKMLTLYLNYNRLSWQLSL